MYPGMNMPRWAWVLFKGLGYFERGMELVRRAKKRVRGR